MATTHNDSKDGRSIELQSRPHIALIGFMGAGKSTVGRLLAQSVEFEFIDLDESIVKSTQQTIPEFFREHGEVAFRARERAAVRDAVAADKPTVIATGGGTFADPTARASLQRAARTVYLRASPETIVARLSSLDERDARPMLAGPDPMASVLRLLEQRSGAYESCDIVVPTDGRTPEDVAHAVMQALRLAAMPTRRHVASARRAARSSVNRDDVGAKVSVQASQGPYSIALRDDTGWLGQAVVDSVPGAHRWAILSDTNVAPLHAEPLINALRALGKTVTLHTVAAGEDSKVLATAAHLYDELLDHGITRHDGLVALGGGVVGDITGFVASTLLRGLAYVQVPTTTLAAVDSSVGGKTGVNTARGKNLVGTFYPPKAVLLAASHLRTQSPRQHVAGLIEALKMAATFDATLFNDMLRDADALLAQEPTVTLQIIARAIAIKADVVTHDEMEQGERAVLNYGHTLGHAIETGEHYRILHGEAVGLGMIAESEWADTEGLSHDFSKMLTGALAAFGAPTDWRHANIDVKALGYDKKRLGATVRLPVVRQLGSYELRNVPLTALAEYVTHRKGLS